jgi:hypothetical protein
LICFRRFFHEFLFLRGVENSLPDGLVQLFSTYCKFADFDFVRSHDSIVFCIFSDDYIRTYKLRLKLVVKSFGLAGTNVHFIQQLNKLIFHWSFSYNYINCFFDIWSGLDLYIYKLLWNTVRRRHPRRPHTWIYAKYWKFFNGFYRFYFLNSLTGGFSILRSHFYLNYRVSRFPLSCNFFNFFDENKFNFYSFNKFKYSFIGIFKFLWFRQRGVCFLCKKVFNSFNFKSLKVLNFHTMRNNSSSYYLVHSYCFF